MPGLRYDGSVPQLQGQGQPDEVLPLHRVRRQRPLRGLWRARLCLGRPRLAARLAPERNPAWTCAPVIDIHSHILPGLDDGPESADESVRIARIAALDGARAILATPHVR